MRRFICALSLAMLLAPLGTAAQRPEKVPRIGYLTAGSPSGAPHLLEAFRKGLRELGWVEGQNIAIEFRSAEGKVERLPDLAAELVRLQVDLIVVPSTPPALAAKNATR